MAAFMKGHFSGVDRVKDPTKYGVVPGDQPQREPSHYHPLDRKLEFREEPLGAVVLGTGTQPLPERQGCREGTGK